MVKRGKGKVQGSLKLRDAYKRYIKEYPKGDTFFVEYKEYREVCELNNKLALKLILEESEVYKMYANLGDIEIEKKKMILTNLENKMKVDWKASKEAGTRIFHLNEHSDGHKYKFKWNKKTSRITNKKAYSLIINRTDKRRLAAHIKAGRDYFN